MDEGDPKHNQIPHLSRRPPGIAVNSVFPPVEGAPLNYVIPQVSFSASFRGRRFRAGGMRNHMPG